ncbi:YfdX family protein [Caminibacter mediatlanticus TB-2]|uniref:YfdX family protein n=1 Tax=Caminibacter mediatlanticus TB-2 TaxID=391592 RepID=A0ABX5V898_9BACT|nr:YfdX family protein [Caminibacter mediatlanticus]QCT94502.1 YfdX family protein [Caminibacter mediatlanticus TB-2]
MKKIVTSIVLGSLLVSNTFAIDAKTANVNKNAVIKAEKNAQNTQLVKEAIRAIQYTQEALMYLKNKKIKKAKEALKNAVGQLAIVLNTPKAPYLLPVDIQIEAYQFQGKLKDIAKMVNQAKLLVVANKLPAAREVLNALRDEIVIKTVNLPLATYPAALNLAIKYINEGKIKEAEDVLAMALSTLVEVDTIIPIPLIKAEALVSEASKIVKKDKKQALKYLEEAKYQLKLAETLGYTSKSDTTYKMLRDEISKLEKEIKRNHNTKGLFEELLKKLKEFKEKAIQHINK